MKFDLQTLVVLPCSSTTDSNRSFAIKNGFPTWINYTLVFTKALKLVLLNQITYTRALFCTHELVAK